MYRIKEVNKLSKKKTAFDESLINNKRSYDYYIDVMTEIAISRFEWENLPESCDERTLELTLFKYGKAVFFEDEDLGEKLTLPVIANGPFNVYGIPVNRRAYSKYNSYSKELTDEDSVIIYNNRLRRETFSKVQLFAYRLWSLDRAIDVNVNAQKTPVLIRCEDKNRLSFLNLYKEYDGNAPVIFGDKSLDPNTFSVLNTSAPFTAKQIHDIRNEIWNDAMTMLGVPNTNVRKRERLIADEVSLNKGVFVSSRYGELESRRKAASLINKMFGEDIKVYYRSDDTDIESERLQELMGIGQGIQNGHIETPIVDIDEKRRELMKNE